MERIVHGILFLNLTLGALGETRILEVGPTNGINHATVAVPNPTTDPAGNGPAESAATTSDTIRFLNGDRFHGILQSFDPRTGIRWQSPEVNRAIEFKPRETDRIKLHRPGSTARRPSSTVIVRLTNNDELPGNLVSLDADKLSLDTWYAGKIAIQRKLLRSITSAQGNSYGSYEGPTGLEGWKAGSGLPAWNYENGAFLAVRPCAIGRDFKLPGMSNIEFDMVWRGQLQLYVGIYTDSLENYSASDCYVLNIQPGYCDLQRVARNGGQSQLGQVQIPSLNQQGKGVRIGIRSNKEQATISLWLDGALVQQWKDPAGFVGHGGDVLFLSQALGSIKLSNIEVAGWDGRSEDQTGTAQKTKEDIVRLVNHDKVSGMLQTIHDGKISFVTSYATTDIPMDRVATIEMAGEKAELAGKNEDDVRISFFEGGRVTLLLESWDNQQAIGSSPGFGRLKFHRDALQDLQFNLYQEKRSTEIPAIREDGEMEELE